MVKPKPIPTLTAKQQARFWSHVIRQEGDGCWFWNGCFGTKGYGEFANMYAHRVVWMLTHGPIGDGLTIDHLCRNHGCVNPAHLEPVTVRENILRGNGAGARNARATKCSRGHEFTTQPDGSRDCLTCRKLYKESFYAQLAADPVMRAAYSVGLRARRQVQAAHRAIVAAGDEQA